jgi:Tol biopolymer transport system component
MRIRSSFLVGASLAMVAMPAASASGAGSRILFQSLAPNGGDTLYSMGADGSAVRRLKLKVPGSAISADWSPDGKRIAFAVQVGNAQSIWTADADGGNANEVFHCAGKCLSTDYRAWAPNGKTIAFTYYDATPPPTAGPPSGDSIRVIDVQSRKLRVVVRSKLPTLVDLARWSPDGKQLVIERDRFSASGTETGCRIKIVSLRDGHARPLTSFDQFGFHPDWSSTGQLITFDTYDLLAFQGSAPDGSNLYTIRPDGHAPRQLTHFRTGGNRVSAATFTPDGKRITFTYQVGGRRRAGIISSGGGAIRTVRTAYTGPVTHSRLSPSK